MGSPDFAVPALKALQHHGYPIVAVYCQPPRSKDRGHSLQKGAVHKAAEEMGIPIYTPISLKTFESQQHFASHQADAAVVAAYGLILPQAILETPRYGCYNIHASLLPRWRGAAPIQRAILAGDTETGVTIMQMEAGLDTGPMIAKAAVKITAATTAPLLQSLLAQLGADLMVKTLEDIKQQRCQSQRQPENGITYAPKLTKAEGELDFTKSAVHLDRQVRALNPWPGTWFVHHTTPIKVLAATPILETQGTMGHFWSTPQYPLIVTCHEGSLVLQRLQRPGGRILEAADFIRGYPLALDL